MLRIAAALVVLSVLGSSPVLAAMDGQQRTRFISRCEASMYMTAPQCTCMAGIAAAKLDDLAIAYLSLDPLDVRNSAAMSKKMTAKELSSIDNFMKTAPHTCASAE
ncbi:MAG TPA: hypothetical protein VHA07_09110 [Devosia sp.]|nr:hypothetical protein [Devosia sp.]